jgi:hypothetical protein
MSANTASNAQGGGGALSTFYNCTITNNTTGTVCGGGWNCTFVNSISWDNNVADYFSGSWTNNYSCAVDYAGTNSITIDPLFDSPGNYHLKPSSPCRDIGNNSGWVGLADSLDLDGRPRILPPEGIVDMGAYEYEDESSSNSSSNSSISSLSSLSSLSSNSSLSSISSFPI